MLKLLIRSMQLDFEFMFIKNIWLSNKIIFILKKYILLAKNFIFWFQKWISYISVFNKKYFFDDKFWLAFLQSVYVDNSFLSKYIKNNSTIVDIWSNIWQYNFFCYNYLNAKEVYSFEPFEETFDILIKNSWDKNLCSNLALNNTFWEVEFFMPWTSLMASTLDDWNSKKFIVKCNKLDNVVYIKAIDKIDLLKIDTEWSEMEVLLWAEETIKKSKYILIESSISRKSNWDITKQINLLSKYIWSLEILYFGRPYMSDNWKIDAVDILFINNDI